MEPEAQSQSQIKKVSKPSSANSVYNYMASSKKSSTRRRPMIVRHKSRASPTGLTHGSNSNPNTRSQSPLSEGWVDLLDGEEEEDEEDEEDQTRTFCVVDIYISNGYRQDPDSDSSSDSDSDRRGQRKRKGKGKPQTQTPRLFRRTPPISHDISSPISRQWGPDSRPVL